MFKTSAETCQDFKDKSKMIELPCKVGDTVWCITDNGKIVERIARTFRYLAELGIEIEATKWEYDKRCRMQLKTSIIHSDDIGKTVFLTREEAEQALRERGLK